jgi:hypothetical protein
MAHTCAPKHMQASLPQTGWFELSRGFASPGTKIGEPLRVVRRRRFPGDNDFPEFSAAAIGQRALLIEADVHIG